MSKLVLLQAGEAIPYELSPQETVLGRHPDCTIQLQSNMVSRRHARVVARDGRHFVEDLGSGNGTYLNGQRIDGAVELKHNDRIKLGPILLRFESLSGSHASTVDIPALPSSFGWGAPSRNPHETEAEMPVFQLNVLEDTEHPTEQIIGSVSSESGYGLLDSQPEKKLRGIIEISRAMAQSVQPKELLPKILSVLFEIFPHADRGSILLKNPTTGRLVPAHQQHRRQGDDATVKLSRTVLQKVLEEKSGILSADAAKEFQGSESIADLSIHSMMCVPMLGLNNEVIGIINIDTQNPIKQFNSLDLDLLVAVAGEAALKFENARLLESHLERVRQDSEMEIARRVQRALLPESLPEVEGYQFFASYDSAQAVGGDYYDAILLSPDKICLAFGDVAGKGVPGALIMSRIASCVQNTMAFVHDVGSAIQAINKHMCFSMAEGRFVTFVLVVIDLANHEMSLANAGHMSPIIRKPDGTVELFHEDAVGIPVGITEDYPYKVVTRPIELGETVVIITDGVDEAMNPAGKLYTKERVIEFIKNGSPNAEELGKALLADVRKHADGRPQNDDITIMTFGRDPA